MGFVNDWICAEFQAAVMGGNVCRRRLRPDGHSGRAATFRSMFILLGLVSILLGIACFVLAPKAFSQFAVPGTFATSSSGAATYTVPIAIPPGTHGVVPQLSLSYNSQAHNGMLGVGWSLVGLPSVTRCPQTLAQDGGIVGVGYASSDRFCLDGQRLVLISGTYGGDGAQYRTERDSYSEIVSHGSAGTGPAWFEVHTKSGLEMDFGNSADSRVSVQSSSTIRLWDLNKVGDTAGNYYLVTYAADAAGYMSYPCTISYTGNAAASVQPYNTVQFVYATSRTDAVPAYRAGAETQMNWLLSDIKTYTSSVSGCTVQGSGLVNDYSLSYQTSASTGREELKSVTLKDASGNSLPSTNFTWSQGQSSPFSTNKINTVPVTGGLRAIGNFSGSGRSDIVSLVSGTSDLWTANEDGSFTHGTFNLPVNPSGYFVFTGDWNGDGKTDLALINSVTTGTAVYIFVSTGSGFTQASLTGTISSISSQSSAFVGDFNGDGRSDILVANAGTWSVWQSQGCSGSPLYCTFSNVAGPSSVGTVGDFNGDGITDVVTSGINSVQVYLGPNFTSGFSVTPPAGSLGLLVVGDWNGDGLSDIGVIPYNGAANATFYTSTGNGFVALGFQHAWYSQSDFLVPIDFNGDGKTDLYIGLSGTNINTGAQIWTSTGTSFNNTATVPGGYYDNAGWTGDFDGNGVPDVWLSTSPNGGSVYASLTTFIPDAITSFTDGLGASTSATYTPLDRAAVYTKGTSAQYPTQDLASTMYVVSQVSKTDGVGGFYKTNYAYNSGEQDLQGRGFLGFSQISADDLQNNIITNTAYNVAWSLSAPYAGMIASVTKTLGSCTIDSVTNSYSSTYSQPASEYLWQVFLHQTVHAPRELDCTALPTITTTHTSYDAYGNPTATMVSSSDSYSKTTTNTYSNRTPSGGATTPWILGLLTQSQVNATAPSPPTPPNPAPASCTISASPTSILTGSSSTLNWSAVQSTTQSISPTVGSVVASGNIAVTPTSTTTYTMSVTGPRGPGSCSATVTVNPAPPPTCTLTASPNWVGSGGQATLQWTSTNSTSQSISPTPGSVGPNGSTQVGSGTYTMTVTGGGGTAQCTAAVQVIPSGLIFAGGSTEASRALRDIFNCFGMGVTGNPPNQPMPYEVPPVACSGGPTLPKQQVLYAPVADGAARAAMLNDDPTNSVNGLGTPASNNQLAYTSLYFPEYNYPGLDFVVSEAPLTSAQIRTFNSSANNDASSLSFSGSIPANVAGPIMQFPLFAMSITIPFNGPNFAINPANSAQIVNSSEATSNLLLSTASLCGIFTGAITDWSDWSLTNDNGGVPLVQAPTPIKVVVRSDNDGTSYILSQFLTANCPAAGYTFTGGVNSNPNWSQIPPSNLVLAAAPGGVGMRNTVNQTANSIGYGGLGFSEPLDTTQWTNPNANIQNFSSLDSYRGTPFAAPSTLAITHALASVGSPPSFMGSPAPAQDPNNWAAAGQISTPTQSDSYPIVGFVWVISYTCFGTASANPNPLAGSDVKGLFNWLVNQGGGKVRTILPNYGFVPLPTAAGQNWSNAVYQLTNTFAATHVSVPGAAGTSCAIVTGGVKG